MLESCLQVALIVWFKDARTLEELTGSSDGLIPDLEQEYQRLSEELEREQAEVAEIEGGDQAFLNELKATVAEQKYVRSCLNICLVQSCIVSSIEIEALKAELSEGKDQLRRLQERAQELDAQKREAKNAIATAERILHRKKNSTRSEVFRLKGKCYQICRRKSWLTSYASRVRSTGGSPYVPDYQSQS